MSDSERIIELLKAVERRTRANRIAREIASTFAFALLFPALFKAIDLFVSFRTATVTIFFSIWAGVTAAALVWRVRGLGRPLQRVAADVDASCSSHDQLKTAYWFIRNPKESPWVQLQIRQAAAKAREIQMNDLYPRQLPRAVYAALGLVVLLGVLNFLPLPWNYNWFYLQGAPAFNLDDSDKAALQRAMELLEKAEASQKSDVSEKLDELIHLLQTGNISKDQLSRSLSEIQQSLAEGNLDAGRITDGLEQVAQALESASLTKPAADKIFNLDLNAAAQEVRELTANLDTASESTQREAAERLQQASDEARHGIEQLAQSMANSAEAMRRGDTAASRRALERTAQDLEGLQRFLESQRLRGEASRQLASVQESIGGMPPEAQQGKGEGQAQAKGEGQGEGEGEGKGQGEGQGRGKGDAGNGQQEGNAEGQAKAGGRGEQGGGGDGRGGNQAGTSGPPPMRGEPTSLETQLEKEPLPVRPTRGSRPETIEEASQRERSRLDYRNVKSNLTPAQKDALNQDPIPLEQREFVKEYMESLRP